MLCRVVWSLYFRGFQRLCLVYVGYENAYVCQTLCVSIFLIFSLVFHNFWCLLILMFASHFFMFTKHSPYIWQSYLLCIFTTWKYPGHFSMPGFYIKYGLVEFHLFFLYILIVGVFLTKRDKLKPVHYHGFLL